MIDCNTFNVTIHPVVVVFIGLKRLKCKIIVDDQIYNLVYRSILTNGKVNLMLR